MTGFERWLELRGLSASDAMRDADALAAIFDAMDGDEWNADLWDTVSEIIRGTGRTFAPMDVEVADG